MIYQRLWYFHCSSISVPYVELRFYLKLPPGKDCARFKDNLPVIKYRGKIFFFMNNYVLHNSTKFSIKSISQSVVSIQAFNGHE